MLGNEKKIQGNGSAQQNLKSEPVVADNTDAQFGEREAKDMISAIVQGTIAVLSPQIQALKLNLSTLQQNMNSLQESFTKNKEMLENFVQDRAKQLSDDIEAKKAKLEKDQLSIAANVDSSVKKSLDDVTKQVTNIVNVAQTKVLEFEQLRNATINQTKQEVDKLVQPVLTSLKVQSDTVNKALAAIGELEAKLHGTTISIQPIVAKLEIPMLQSKK